jgi:hypothetical protein
MDGLNSRRIGQVRPRDKSRYGFRRPETAAKPTVLGRYAQKSPGLGSAAAARPREPKLARGPQKLWLKPDAADYSPSAPIA